MIAAPSTTRPSRALEFGMYRDGDNNLDEMQANSIRQALTASKTDRTIEFNVEDTTSRQGFAPDHVLRTESYQIADGAISKHVTVSAPHDMSARSELASFVAQTLDKAQASGAAATWIDLIDHGGGDGGGLQSSHSATGLMREDDMAGAIADGIAAHAKAHPEDADRTITGVVANQCLMSTLGFASALSHAGVGFLAASPETMLAPGVPTTVAHDIAAHLDDPLAMARAVVDTTMDATYGIGAQTFAPAAAFDVIDLDPKKLATVTHDVKQLNDRLASAAANPETRLAIRQDARTVDGMVRFPEGRQLPWRADRPAIAVYTAFSEDTRLPSSVRAAALHAAHSVASTVLAHRESADYKPFDDADYSDAYGPTTHFPVTAKQIDTWAPKISETDNNFYKSVDGGTLSKAVA